MTQLRYQWWHTNVQGNSEPIATTFLHPHFLPPYPVIGRSLFKEKKKAGKAYRSLKEARKKLERSSKERTGRRVGARSRPTAARARLTGVLQPLVVFHSELVFKSWSALHYIPPVCLSNSEALRSASLFSLPRTNGSWAWCTESGSQIKFTQHHRATRAPLEWVPDSGIPGALRLTKKSFITGEL